VRCNMCSYWLKGYVLIMKCSCADTCRQYSRLVLWLDRSYTLLLLPVACGEGDMRGSQHACTPKFINAAAAPPDRTRHRCMHPRGITLSWQHSHGGPVEQQRPVACLVKLHKAWPGHRLTDGQACSAAPRPDAAAAAAAAAAEGAAAAKAEVAVHNS
jgi:hypothetical protein